MLIPTGHARRPSVAKRLSQNAGFTLIELLIVIGIILILIGILLPTVTQVRVAAQTASTRQMLARIETGIQTYYTNFLAYPGPFANGQIGTTPTLGTETLAYRLDGTVDTTAVNITSTENLFLGIVGGLKTSTTAPRFLADISTTSFPTGAASLNPANPKKYQTYIDVSPQETTALTTPRYFPTNAKGFGGSADTNIPEIMDKYSQPMPILYLRAMRGNGGVIDSTNNLQYNFSHLAPYGFTSIDAAYAPAAADRPYAYFGNPTITGTPLKKDEFMLISAGPDGKYGTNDDVVNFR